MLRLSLALVLSRLSGRLLRNCSRVTSKDIFFPPQGCQFASYHAGTKWCLCCHSKMFTERLNNLCAMHVKEAEIGDRIMSGRVLIAPGEKQMKVLRSGGIYKVNCQAGEKVNGHCPSVGVLFESVAQHVGANAVGIMLTGMGADGADSMVSMRKMGARTLAQDEKSCVVFGMPNEAYKRGGAERLVPLDDIAGEVSAFSPEEVSRNISHCPATT